MAQNRQMVVIWETILFIWPSFFKTVQKYVSKSIPTFVSLQKSASENQLSSTTTSGFNGEPLYISAATDEVKTTLLIDGTLEHELKT